MATEARLQCRKAWYYTEFFRALRVSLPTGRQAWLITINNMNEQELLAPGQIDFHSPESGQRFTQRREGAKWTLLI